MTRIITIISLLFLSGCLSFHVQKIEDVGLKFGFTDSVFVPAPTPTPTLP